MKILGFDILEAFWIILWYSVGDAGYRSSGQLGSSVIGFYSSRQAGHLVMNLESEEVLSFRAGVAGHYRV